MASESSLGDRKQVKNWIYMKTQLHDKTCLRSEKGISEIFLIQV